MRLKVMAVFLVLLFIIGCSPRITSNLDYTKYTIGYDYEKIIDNDQLSKLTLSIQPFQDERKNKSSFKTESKNLNSNTTECYIQDCQYGNINTSDTIAELLVNHVLSMEKFKRVSFNEKEQSDLYMTSNLVSFAVHTTIDNSEDGKKFRIAMAVGSQFGLIGGAIQYAAMQDVKKVPLDYEIKYTNITIYDKNNKIVFQLPESTSKGNLQVYPDLYGCNLDFYFMINELLYKHNKSFIDKIINELPKALRNTKT